MALGIASTALGQNVPKDIVEAINSASLFVDWKPGDDFYPKENAKLALENGKACVEKLEQAITGGIANSTAIETDKGNVTVGEARSMCVAVRDKGQKFFGELTEKEEAVFRPFRKALTGDKLRIYNDRLKSYKLYGVGGKVLRTAAEYRDSALWCTTGVDRDGLVPIWAVDCWHFKGMAMVGSVTSRTGSGDEAPSSAFR
jgi:hypothetical protein